MGTKIIRTTKVIEAEPPKPVIQEVPKEVEVPASFERIKSGKSTQFQLETKGFPSWNSTRTFLFTESELKRAEERAEKNKS